VRGPREKRVDEMAAREPGRAGDEGKSCQGQARRSPYCAS
jgi:hypothetical protein